VFLTLGNQKDWVGIWGKNRGWDYFGGRFNIIQELKLGGINLKGLILERRF